MTTVYRGDLKLIHIEDGQRAVIGQWLAGRLDSRMRMDANEGPEQAAYTGEKPLCPGCYMVAIFNCALALAKANGQSLTELGNSLGNAFLALAQDGSHAEAIESIEVQLDSEPCPTREQLDELTSDPDSPFKLTQE